MRVVWNAVLAIAIAGAVIAAVPAFAGWDEDNSTNDGMMSSQPTAAEKGALRDSMLRNQWGTRHTNLYLEQFINSRSRTTIQNLLSYPRPRRSLRLSQLWWQRRQRNLQHSFRLRRWLSQHEPSSSAIA